MDFTQDRRRVRDATLLSAGALALALGGVQAMAASAGGAAPARPACTDGVPVPFFAFAPRSGVQLIAYQGRPYRSYYATFGLRALRDLPGHLLMESAGFLAVSRDEGCSWEVVAELGAGEWPLWVTPAPGGDAYAFALNGSTFYHVQYDGIDFRAVSRRTPASHILGVGSDPSDPLTVTLSDSAGQMHRSFDGGETWQRLGTNPPAGALTYRMGFDPTDPDHAVFGAATDGGWVTFDAGATWTAVTGLSASGGPANLFNVVVSPADPTVVWAMALDVDQSTMGHPSQGKHIYRSTDGGRSFTPVIDNSAEVTITNGPELTPHPTDPSRMAWVFGSTFSGLEIYQYDAGLDRLLHAHHGGYLARVAEYYPADPRHLYIGLEGGL